MSFKGRVPLFQVLDRRGPHLRIYKMATTGHNFKIKSLKDIYNIGSVKGRWRWGEHKAIATLTARAADVPEESLRAGAYQSPQAQPPHVGPETQVAVGKADIGEPVMPQ